MSQLPESENICWLMVGSTGCGKSSLINTLTDSNVKVSESDEHESCTKDPDVFKCNKDPNILLMDTVGFEDTSGKTFEEVLISTSNMLHSKGSKKIKVIWCVKPQDKSTPALKKQARFINSLNENIWKSVMVIVKQGMVLPHYNGVNGASEEYTKINNIKLPIYSIHGLDWIDDASNINPYCFLYSLALQERSKRGCFYLFNKEIPQLLIDKLSKIEYSNAIKYKKKFNHKENHTILVKEKHLGILKEKYIHSKDWKEEREHSVPITLEKYHSCGKSPTYGHSGELVKKKTHKSDFRITQRYHSLTYNSKKSYHPEALLACPCCESRDCGSFIRKDETLNFFSWRSKYQYYLKCAKCGKCDASTDVRNGFIKCKSCSKRCCLSCKIYKCSSCGCRSTSEGCKNSSSWSCCGESNKNAIGCKEKYLRECCGEDYKSEGCSTEMKYENCDHKVFEKGCVIIKDEFTCGNPKGCEIKKYYKCCGNGANSRCNKISKSFYECCNKNNKNSIGCKDKSKYSECRHAKGTKECAVDYEYYSCCGTKKNDELTIVCGKVEWIPENYKSSKKLKN